MLLKKRFLFRLFLIIFCKEIFSDSDKYNTVNNHGVIGLINLPTARFFDEQSAVFTAYRGDPDRKITLTMMPYDWMEASLFYTSISGKPYGGGYGGDYKDKGFNAKFRLKKQDNFPALAIGLNDFAGTGIYSSEYMVASHAIGNYDLHLGIGWGVLSGGSLAFDNFLKDIDQNFSNRSSNVGKGGEFLYENYFSGEEMALFGGISYIHDKNWLFKAEYDSTDINTSYGFPQRSSNINISFENISRNNFNYAISFERGDYVGFKFSWYKNAKNVKGLDYKKSDSEFKSPHEKLKYLLSLNNIGTKKIYQNENKMKLEIMEYAYTDYSNLEKNILNSISDSGIQVEEVLVSYNTAGLKPFTKNYSVSKRANSNQSYLYERKNKITHNYAPSITIRPYIAARESFLKTAVFFEVNSEVIFRDNLFLSTNIKYPILQNFDDLYLPPADTFPAQVRSDIKDYLNNMKGRIILGRAQLDHFLSSQSSKNHFQFSLGIFEEMYGGIGFEYLRNNPSSNFAWGLEVFNVRKRDYDLNFDFKDYSNTTSHLNFYYENKNVLPFTMHLSFGEYLAGDKGYTVDISRRFKNGVSMGFFVTRTDVSKELFGEGSFDKGVYFSFPITNNFVNYVWRPLTKDPGAKLIRKNNLYDLTRKFKFN